jgi:hypothetical protein
MDMFGGLTKTSSRIAIAAALGMTLGGFAMGASPAKAADLGGDCCADLEERVAELEATTVRKGNKKVSVTLSGWVVKLGSWWNDGHESNFYVGDKDTTLSSHFQLSGSAQIAPGWSGGYTLAMEMAGNSCSVGFVENQFNDNACLNGRQNTLLSYMWLKSDAWGTLNWGNLSQATDNVALLPDLSGTIIESNAVLFDGAGMFVRPNGARNANDMARGDFTWLSAVTCIDGGGGVGADCNGYPENGVRYDSPTWAGFSVSGGYYEDHVWDVAVKYAADWNSFKVSAAFGFDQNTDEGCSSPALVNNPGAAGCTGLTNTGAGGGPFQGFRKEVDTAQVGASVMHVPSGLFVYGLYQNEQNNGTQWLTPTFNSNHAFIGNTNSNANDTNVWFLKAGIKRTWTPLGATVIWGEGGQYEDQFTGICSGAGAVTNVTTNPDCIVNIGGAGNFFANGSNFTNNVAITSSTVNRYGVGIVQEIDSAAMHLFARWQHLNLDLNAICTGGVCFNGNTAVFNGDKVKTNFSDLDIFQVGGVIFF